MKETIQNLLWLIPALPLAGFLVNALVGKRLPKLVSGIIGCVGPVAACALSVMALLAVKESGAVSQTVWQWMAAGDFAVDFGFRVDALTAVMLLVVTGVGSLIHIYSIGYMHDDPGFHRFFAYLNLFMFSMLVLVLADNLVVMFVGWEGVGLCSYLLIGFWFTDLKNADAGKKAFIVNRVGDFGFILGIFVLLSVYGTVNFQQMAGGDEASKIIHQVGENMARAASGHEPAPKPDHSAAIAVGALLLFLGACGKSAQIPLFVWLPDAMAGPTPVSALIHAATMVTAGVYMIGRMGFLYLQVPQVMETIAAVAAGTAILTAIIAVAQTDIKKVLAYSTVSQLGFMFAGMASGQFETGVFHIVTHAFFKALLFLGAGAVIHALHGQQDMRKMGGLAKPLPVLAVTFIAGVVALAGLPGSSGYASKDGILAACYERITYSGTFGLVWITLLITAFITAFYTGRLLMMVFYGSRAEPDEPEEEGGEHPTHEIHKPGLAMMVPLVVLATFALLGGLLGGSLEHFLAGMWPAEKASTPEVAGKLADIKHHAHSLNVMLSWILSIGGFGLAFFLYGFKRDWVERFVASDAVKPLHKIVLNKFYVDELYGMLIVTPLRVTAAGLWFVVDRLLIDTLLVNGAGWIVYRAGSALKIAHRGAISLAASAMALGATAMIAYVLYRLLIKHG